MPSRGMIGVALSLPLVLAALGGATRGFTALTSDTARMLEIAEHPAQLTPVPLRDVGGQSQALADPHRSTIVDVIYTRCVTVCAELGSVFQRLQSVVRHRGLSDRVRLLSISFDPGWDTPARLQRYASLMRADHDIWTLTATRDTAALAPLLHELGIRVIADGRNGYVHNAALHVIDATGRLVAILPIDAVNEAIDVALRHTSIHATRMPSGAHTP
jgi:protein SCO1